MQLGDDVIIASQKCPAFPGVELHFILHLATFLFPETLAAIKSVAFQQEVVLKQHRFNCSEGLRKKKKVAIWDPFDKVVGHFILDF